MRRVQLVNNRVFQKLFQRNKPYSRLETRRFQAWHLQWLSGTDSAGLHMASCPECVLAVNSLDVNGAVFAITGVLFGEAH